MHVHCTIDLMFEHTLLTKTTAVQNEVALRYYRVRGLYFLAVVFVTTIVGSCALYALKNQKRTFNSRDQDKVTDIRNTHTV